MAKKILQESFNPDRERSSNFVVDLRSASDSSAPDFKAVHKDSRPRYKFRFKLAKKSRSDSGLGKISSPKEDNNRNVKKQRRAKQPRLKIGRQHWSRIIREKEKALGGSLRYLFKEATPSKNRQTKTSHHLLNRIKKGNGALKLKFLKNPLILFILVLVAIILTFEIFSGQPFKGFQSWQNSITNTSVSAAAKLMAAGDSASKLDFKQANADFQEASANFLTASHKLDKINSGLLSLTALSSDPKLKLVSQSKKLLQAGVLAGRLGSDLVSASGSLFVKNSDGLDKRLNEFLSYGHKAVDESRALSKVLSSIDISTIPVAQRDKFISLRQQLDAMSQGLSDFISAGDQLKDALGLVHNKRYLLVFQNNSEIRASGGFIGSYALVDMSNGKITNLEVPGGGSYDTAGGMTVNVIAPRPLWLLSPLWHFWDANWWPDWPTSAKNLMWFYGKSGGPSVDGVISVTPTVVEDLLKLTGPIKLPAYGLTIDSNNFWQTVETVTEADNIAKTNPNLVSNLPTSTPLISSDLPLKQDLKSNSDNKPKKIIGDLLAKIWQVLPQKMNASEFLQAASLLQKDLASKQILFYFNNPKLEKAVTSRNWGGQVRQTSKDYLMVINSNIGGQKSDHVITEKIDQSSSVQDDGTIIDTVKITREHHGINHTPLTGVRNVDWLRVYVPQGSKLLSASGFKSPDATYLQKRPDANWQSSPLLDEENAALIDPSSGTRIYNEDGKTVFANWSMLDPGQTDVITLSYKLPFNFFTYSESQNWLSRLLVWFHLESPQPLSYSLLVQKQPGAKDDDFTSNLILPDSNPSLGSLIISYPQGSGSRSGWKIKGKLDSDHYYVILLKRNINSQ